MTAFADITINDGQATPVATTFEPASRSNLPNGMRTVWKHNNALAASADVIVVDYLPASMSPNRHTDRVKISISTPVEYTDADTGLVHVQHVPRSTHEFIVPDEAVQADRDDQMAFAANLLDHATIRAIIEDNSPVL